MTNAKLAALIQIAKGDNWLCLATVTDMSDATGDALKEYHCGPMDTRQAVTCLRAMQFVARHRTHDETMRQRLT